MALIPIQEDSQATIETRRAEEKFIKVEGGFALDAQTIAVILISFALIVFLFFWPSVKALEFPYGMSIMPDILIPLLVLALIALMINKSIVVFNEFERGVVFRWGKFDRIAGPGWAIVFPLLERYVKVDMRLEVISLGVQEVVTKDKVRFLIAPEIFMYVSNPKDAVLNVQNYKRAVIQYVNSAVTHTAGDSTSDYIVAHMNEISDMLGHSVEHISNTPGKEWGVVVPRVKLAFIRFPDVVQSAMHTKVASEQLKLAAHEKAEAIKAEIDAIREAGGKLTDPAITYMYLEALDKVARGKATKIVLPLEISKIAETITRRTAGALGGGLETSKGGGPGIPPEIISKYAEIVDSYDKRLKQIENKITPEEEKKERNRMIRDAYRAGQDDNREEHAARRTVKEDREAGAGAGDHASSARIKHRNLVGEHGKETEKDSEDLKEYKERIREIKKRVGIE